MLWGGRFNDKLDNSAQKFSSSLNQDILLINEDIRVSTAHAEMLAEINIITYEEKELITGALNLVRKQYEEKEWLPSADNYEDIHSAVESRLFEIIGDTAGKLHTGRSRNDQAAADLRLWVKKTASETGSIIKELQQLILEKGVHHTETVIPGYTHLQRAQPVSLAFHMLAWYDMLERDKKRVAFVIEQADVCPLGSGALAGSTLPLDRKFTAEYLGFAKISTNAMDAVSDRDFILDFLNCCSTGMLHLSRIAEEIILWSTAEWNFIRLSDKYSTGSSLMPQKKNPDIAELIRGRSGRALGNYVSLSAVIKALPLSYNRDLQEDKRFLFDSVFTYQECLELTGRLINTMEVNTGRFTVEMEGDFSLTTDLADWLVTRGIPFREAHHITGCIVKYCEEKKKKLNNLNLTELKEFSTLFDTSVFEIFDIKNILSRKKTSGSPNPEMVMNRITELRMEL